MNTLGKGYIFRMANIPSPLEPRFDSLVRELSHFVNGTPAIHDEESYSAFLNSIAKIITGHQAALEMPTPLFDIEIQPILKGYEYRFQTQWGGVVNKLLTSNDGAWYDVQKYLVIQQKGMLGLEYHEHKHEELQVKEGLCIGISSIHRSEDWKEGYVTLMLMKPGDACVMEPGDEHGLIALTNCVVEETATKDSGGDLYFVFSDSRECEMAEGEPTESIPSK
jgi:hypothetical protein